MTPTLTTEIAIVGAGVAGVLVARQLVSAQREVLLIERGAHKAHSDQVADGQHVRPVATALPNHEPHPTTPGDPWEYLYGVGGSGLHWGGNAPRFLPDDFALNRLHGVGLDWPFTYRELVPFYEAAEEALAIAGGPNASFGPEYTPPLPPHPYSPVDLLLRSHLQPYAPLPQARPTRPVEGRPACCGSGTCSLCPVDARYSPLHTIATLNGRHGFRLRMQSVVADLRRPGRHWELRCVDAARTTTLVRADTVVLAANGIENAAILLRSRIGGPHVGRWLYDHEHVQYLVEVMDPFAAGVGASIATGISYAWADGPWRGERGSQIVYPDNRGRLTGGDFVDAVVDGRRGAGLRREIAAQFRRRVVLDAIGEDLPQAGRRVELSARRDTLGLPLNRVRYPADSTYLERSRTFLRSDLEHRLRPLGARVVATTRFRGGHQLGTCRMGSPSNGVVDADCRVHGTSRLYAVGGSAFPAYAAAHPTLTIAALAIRLGQHLADD